MKTKIYAGFPGTGKSYYVEQHKGDTDRIILDSDSSKFDKLAFPENYIAHIKENTGKADIIFVSSHDVVREALVKNKIPFTLIYPNTLAKEVYLKRFKDRKSPEAFIKLLETNWEVWIRQCFNQDNCSHIILDSNTFISDVL